MKISFFKLKKTEDITIHLDISRVRIMVTYSILILNFQSIGRNIMKMISAKDGRKLD